MEKQLKECIGAISRVVAEQSIAVYYQPVVSLNSKGVLGFEAFSRGVDDHGNTLADPGCLFNDELPLKAQSKVEELCLRKSLNSYKPLYTKYREMLLFLNINGSVYSVDELKGEKFFEIVESYKYSPRVIVFEFDSAQLKNNIPLDMMQSLRERGYRISVDNTGDIPGCKERLFRIRPDFAKLDRNMFKGIEKSENVKRLIKSTAATFWSAGAIPIAKGVETEEEALALVEAGFVLQQGFYYSESSDENGSVTTLADKISQINTAHRESKAKYTKSAHDTFRDFHLLLKSTITKLQQEDDEGMNRILDELVKKDNRVVSTYVLNSVGKQMSPRFVGKAGDQVGKRIVASGPGSDHSDSELFLYLNSGLEKIAGSNAPDVFCKEWYYHVAGYYYKANGRKGNILIIEYCDIQEEQDQE